MDHAGSMCANPCRSILLGKYVVRVPVLFLLPAGILITGDTADSAKSTIFISLDDGDPFCIAILVYHGSRFFAAIVSMALIIIRAYRERRMIWRDGVNLIVCLLILLVGILLIHVPEGHAVLRPKTISDFMTALGKNLSWPWIDVPFLFPILWSPFAILNYRICISRKEKLSRYPFFIIGLGLWTLLQCIAVAYARGFEGSGPASRYMDLLSMILAVNILSAHYLYRHSAVNFKRRMASLSPALFGMHFQGSVF